VKREVGNLHQLRNVAAALLERVDVAGIHGKRLLFRDERAHEVVQRRLQRIQRVDCIELNILKCF
jgi:hypothetical protein